MKGFRRFLFYCSLTVAGTLVAAIIIVVVVAYQGLGCGRIDAIIAEIRQQVVAEIAEKRITPEDMEAYIQNRIRQELERRGLDVCL